MSHAQTVHHVDSESGLLPAYELVPHTDVDADDEERGGDHGVGLDTTDRGSMAGSGKGIDRDGVKREGRKGDGVALLGAAASTIILLLASWLGILTNDPTSFGWFAFHPLAQSTALAVFTYGILTLQPTSQPPTKAAGLARHQIAMFAFGTPTLLFGSFAVWYNKVFGLVCLLWLTVQVGVGAGSVWYGGKAFGGGAKAKAIWKYHRLSGYLLFPLMLFTAHLGGVWSHWSNTYLTTSVRFLAFILAPVVILVSVYSRIRPSKMQFF
ncbi:hypothetical protein AMATHDRAFT_5206 [Amanita thiersii Skay4041]|uniref:Cytochrome b561 domain-containing protein n=1 Tax=Amanita thiersii Skay4041 TaxID=703135 RepID=A0A2A9NGB0_9AGAR|nr:hypothetical protein AMATHDRAFT_5206 [Amanita thiersii Skay4041]